MSSLDTEHATPELPPVDVHLVPPEERYEMYDGELVYVPPAFEPHGNRHSKLSALLEGHVRADFDVASDMLTRTSMTSDMAPDASVYPLARDPRTGGRQLEQLAFEVVNTESLSHAGEKAAALIGRGVRRVFAIDVKRRRALEWSPSLGIWSLLDATGSIEDPTFVAPLSIASLVTEAKADNAVARALIAKRNTEIEAVRADDRVETRADAHAEGHAEGWVDGNAEGWANGRAEGWTDGHASGRVHGMAGALLVLLEARGIAIPGADRARILGEQDAERLERWIACAARCASVAELFSMA